MKICFTELLTLVMFILKSLGKLNCSWFIVFLPVIISYTIVFIGLLLKSILEVKKENDKELSTFWENLNKELNKSKKENEEE